MSEEKQDNEGTMWGCGLIAFVAYCVIYFICEVFA
jgi:hypothetical protein